MEYEKEIQNQGKGSIRCCVVLCGASAKMVRLVNIKKFQDPDDESYALRCAKELLEKLNEEI